MDGPALAALEQVNLLSQHDEAGLRAISVLRRLIPAAAWPANTDPRAEPLA